jgi:hypothetical protein
VTARKPPIRLLVAVGFGGLLFGSGCAIQPDSSPRDIPEDMREQEAPSPAGVAGVAGGSDRIYLMAPDGATATLRTVQRDTGGDPQALLQALLDGPNLTEVEEGYRSVLPEALALRSVSVETGGVVEVDLSDDLLDLSGVELVDAVAQIVYTASEIGSARSVLIRIEGATQAWPDGSGAQQRRPLTTYDFIGYAESAQPPFPVSPSPTTAVPPSTTSTTIAPTTPPTTTAPPSTTAPAPAATTTLAPTATPTTTAPPVPAG